MSRAPRLRVIRQRPVLVYDGDCAFCTRAVRVALRLRPDADVVAWQFADLTDLGLTEQAVSEALQWVEPDGQVASGHHAVAALLLRAGLPWSLAGRAMRLPGVSWLAARVYAWVAANRGRLPGGTAACALPPDQRPSA